jgi:hypothetical protein
MGIILDGEEGDLRKELATVERQLAGRRKHKENVDRDIAELEKKRADLLRRQITLLQGQLKPEGAPVAGG